MGRSKFGGSAQSKACDFGGIELTTEILGTNGRISFPLNLSSLTSAGYVIRNDLPLLQQSMAVLDAATGIQYSGITGLQWRDVDLETATPGSCTLGFKGRHLPATFWTTFCSQQTGPDPNRRVRKNHMSSLTSRLRGIMYPAFSSSEEHLPKESIGG